jgi:MFS family permease
MSSLAMSVRSSTAFRPLTSAPFRNLWIGQLISAFGDRLIPVALAFAVIDAGGRAGSLSAVLMAGLIPQITLMLLGGVWGDRLPRARVMIVADTVRAAMQGLTAVIVFSGHVSIPAIAGCYAVYGAATAFFSPASTGLVPATVDSSLLQEANALMRLSRNMIGVAGPLLSGALVAFVGPGTVFSIDSASFVVSIAFLARISVPLPPRELKQGVWADLREGFRETVERRWILISITSFMVIQMANASFMVLGPLVAKRSFGGALGWGVITTGGAAGFFIGSLVALRVKVRRPLVTAFLLVPLISLQLAALAIPLNIAILVVLSVGATMGMSYSNTAWFTALQRWVPEEKISRVSAYDWLVSLVATPLAYAAIAPIVGVTSVSLVLWGSAALILAAGLFAIASRSVRAVTVD